MITVFAIKNRHGAGATPGSHQHQAKAKPSCFVQKIKAWTPSRNRTHLPHSNTETKQRLIITEEGDPQLLSPDLTWQ